MADGGHLKKLQTAKSLKRIIRLTLCMQTGHTLPSDSSDYYIVSNLIHFYHFDLFLLLARYIPNVAKEEL